MRSSSPSNGRCGSRSAASFASSATQSSLRKNNACGATVLALRLPDGMLGSAKSKTSNISGSEFRKHGPIHGPPVAPLNVTVIVVRSGANRAAAHLVVSPAANGENGIEQTFRIEPAAIGM